MGTGQGGKGRSSRKNSISPHFGIAHILLDTFETGGWSHLGTHPFIRDRDNVPWAGILKLTSRIK